MYANACLLNCQLFIRFLVRLAFWPSGGAPKGPQLAKTIARSRITLAPPPHRHWLAPGNVVTSTHWFLIQMFLFHAFVFHKNAWIANLGSFG
jgi:hypothetical protein